MDNTTTAVIQFYRPDRPAGQEFKIRVPDDIRDQITELSDLSKELGEGHMSVERAYTLCVEQALSQAITAAKEQLREKTNSLTKNTQPA